MVSIELGSMVAVAEESSGLGASTMSASTLVKWPRILLIIRWRTVKATSEWPGSSL